MLSLPYSTRQLTKRDFLIIGGCFVMGLMLLMFVFSALGCSVAADGDNTGNYGSTMFKTILNIVCTIVIIIGVILGVVGLAKFAIAHAEGQGADQQKAIMMLATGIILVILPTILKGFSNDLSNMITNAANDYKNVG